MARVSVELPSVLATVLEGRRSVELDAATLADALRALVRSHPELETHLFDETGELRQHVLCFHNRTNSRWLENRDQPLADGDVLTILQAVSGG